MTGNKGEWSELYTHFRLLGDGYLFPADEKDKPARNLGSPIVQIMRRESKENKDNIFFVDNAKKSILFKGQNKEMSISQDTFIKLADFLLSKIKSSKKDSISVEEIETTMSEYEMSRLKGASIEKADIRMVLHNMITHRDTAVGFSIKSKLGGRSTLFNSNKDGTNFLYEIIGGITDEQLAELNSMSDTEEKRRKGFFKRWFERINEWGYNVEYRHVIDKTFACNLQYVDITFDKVLAECILTHYKKITKSTTKEIVGLVADKNPCHVCDMIKTTWYVTAMKRFLVYYALGMTANKMWNNKMHANGGYIVVREDGDIVTYHFYDVTQLGNYLFNNTAFDTPSTSRHMCYQVFRGDDGKAYMKLNPQIRFIHDK